MLESTLLLDCHCADGLKQEYRTGQWLQTCTNLPISFNDQTTQIMQNLYKLHFPKIKNPVIAMYCFLTLHTVTSTEKYSLLRLANSHPLFNLRELASRNCNIHHVGQHKNSQFFRIRHVEG